MSATEHKSIGDALVAFQAEVPTLAKDATNPHFRSKFTPLDTIVETIRPILAKHGLAWSALPCLQDGQPALRYELRHAATGQVIGDTMPLLVVKADPQGIGSAITYARRYSLSAVLNLVADEDDDGNSASRRAQNGGAQQPTAAPAQQTDRPASAKQRGLLNAKADAAGLPPSDFANAILLATRQGTRSFDSQEAAEQWLKRALDRLPAKYVDGVIEQIEQIGAAS